MYSTREGEKTKSNLSQSFMLAETGKKGTPYSYRSVVVIYATDERRSESSPSAYGDIICVRFETRRETIHKEEKV